MSESRPIVAVVTTSRDEVGGGVPIFYCNSKEQLQYIAFTLEKCLDASVHEITPSVLILARH